MTRLQLSRDEVTVRSDLGGNPRSLIDDGSSVLLRLLHVSDMHLIDAGSPARSDWVEAKADDPKWHPLLHMCRPFDTLVNWGLASFVRGAKNNGGELADLAIFTGDNIDNAQQNELDAYLALLDGGTFSFPYEGPQEAHWASDPRTASLRDSRGRWPFWVPDGGVNDLWQDQHGYPNLPGLLHETGRQITSPGLGLPWLPVMGNHDVMRQGTAYSTPHLDQIATGAWRAATGPANFAPPSPFDAYMANVAAFSDGEVRFPVSRNPGRRSITRTEFIGAHIEQARRLGHARGFTSTGSGDYVHDCDYVRIVVLDTNHPDGHYQGSIGDHQLVWLHEVLTASDRDQVPVLVATHHGGISLDNTYVDPSPLNEHSAEDRKLAAEMEAVLHRHRSVVAWLVGHRHIHRIRPISDPLGVGSGFWEITTGSLIDSPTEARLVEVIAGADQSIGIRTSIVSHDDCDTEHPEQSIRLGALHRHLAEIEARTGPETRGRRNGRPGDRAAVLARPVV